MVELIVSIVSAITTGLFAGEVLAGVLVGLLTFMALLIGSYAINCIKAPYRVFQSSLTVGSRHKNENDRLRAENHALRQPRFHITVPRFHLGQGSDGKLICTTVVRASNCGIIPSTLDEWQAQLHLKNGQIIEMKTVHRERFMAWDEGHDPANSPPDMEILGDQFIYERTANIPIGPGHKAVGFFVGQSDHPDILQADDIDGASFIVDAIDSSGHKQVGKEVMDNKNFGGPPIYVPGLRSTERNK